MLLIFNGTSSSNKCPFMLIFQYTVWFSVCTHFYMHLVPCDQCSLHAFFYKRQKMPVIIKHPSLRAQIPIRPLYHARASYVGEHGWNKIQY